MAGIAVRLFGQPALIASGATPADPVAIGAKSLALLAFLLLEPGPHSRERLATLLWGEHPDEAARASLRQALMQLRAVVGGALRVTRTIVELGPIGCDALDFLEAANHDSAAAAGYDVPRFLEGFVVRQAPASTSGRPLSDSDS